jgi:peptidoglycan/xylan/chitin deacetylase (PgdA/CDA1 family)
MPNPLTFFIYSRLQTAAAALILGVCASAAQAQSVALTFDDGPNLADMPLLSPQQRNQALLDALASHQVPAALFMTCGFGADKPAGYALAQAWGNAGHAVGNHTMTHPDLNSPKLSLAQYQQEVLDCDRITRTLPGYQKWFRYTFLREGNTPEKRDGMRAFLKERGYRNAYVTLDTSDWRLDGKLKEVLKKNPQADIAPIKQAYLSHLRQRAIAYRDLSRRQQGRDIPQVMLLHHNLINALWLKDAIEQFIDMGWTFVSPAQAFADPVYQLAPERPATGQSLLLSIARSQGAGKFEGWERLVDDGDFEIDALKLVYPEK